MADDIKLTLPEAKNQELQTVIPRQDVSANQGDFYGVISKANQYLWFAFGVVALGIVVYAWFKLITAKGDEKEMKKLWSTLVGLIIWLFIAIFSFLIVKLIINLI